MVTHCDDDYSVIREFSETATLRMALECSPKSGPYDTRVQSLWNQAEGLSNDQEQATASTGTDCGEIA
jgi:hypothetical protein